MTNFKEKTVTRDPIKEAIEAAAMKIAGTILARVRKEVVATVDKAIAECGAPVERKPAVKREEPARPRVRATRAAIAAAIERLVRRRDMTDYAIAKRLNVYSSQVHAVRTALSLPAVGKFSTKKPAKPARPARRPMSTLSPDERAAVEAAVRTHSLADNAISRQFNVSQPNVSQLRRSLGLSALGIRPGSGEANRYGMPVAPVVMAPVAVETVPAGPVTSSAVEVRAA
jgi:predicted XRE-type DNA-binding protein